MSDTPSRRTVDGQLRGWLKIGSAAVYADVSVETMRKWLGDGLKYVVIGSCKRTRPDWIDEYLEAGLVQASQSGATKARSIVRSITGAK